MVDLSIAALGAVVADAARAADDAGPYVGASIGRSQLTAGAETIDGAFAAQGLGTSTSLDRNDTSYALTLGYRVSKFFAFEGNYIDFGKYRLTSAVNSPALDTINGQYKADGFDLVAVGILPLDDGFAAYGKLGALWSKAQLDAASTGAVNVSGESHSGTGLTYGLGLSYDLTRNVSTKVEWNRYDHIGSADSTGRTDANVYSLGVAYLF